MKQILCLSFFLLLLYTNLLAQKSTTEFEISLPEKKVGNSLYNTIEFIDSRFDVTNMGVVQLGAFNKKARVIASVPLQEQFAKVLNALTDSSSKKGWLLFQLRQFSFAEITGAMSEKGYCYLRAELYAKNANSYSRLASIDTVILVKSMDVTKALFRNGSKTITDFIGSNLIKNPADSVSYTFNDVLNIDDLEKRKIPLYTAKEYAEGIYTTYQSFKNQVPDKQATVEVKDEAITSVKTVDENGKQLKVKTKDVYALIYQGQPFIATDYGYYPLRKTNTDFYFTGKAKVTANAGDVIAASVFFGIIGGLIASGSSDATFEMKIDHINGGFIRLREVNSIQ